MTGSRNSHPDKQHEERARLQAGQEGQEQQHPNRPRSLFIRHVSQHKRPNKQGHRHSQESMDGYLAQPPAPMLWRRCSAGGGRLSTARNACLAAVGLAALFYGGLLLASGGGSGTAPLYGSSRRTGGSGPPHQPQQQQQQCSLDLEGSPWEHHCQRVQWVCVDQERLILWQPQYQELEHKQAGDLPQLTVDSTKIYDYPWRWTSKAKAATEAPGNGGSSSNTDSSGSGGGISGGGSKPARRLAYQVQDPTRTRRIDVVRMRPATSREPRRYLQTPSFSTCTVPLLLHSSWRDNYFHIFRDLGNVMHSLLRRTPWRQHAKLVVVTPEGLPLTGPESQLLPPLSNMSVQTLADFSRRLPLDYQPRQELHPEPGLPASYEGGEQRCFRDLFFCGRKIAMGRGKTAEEEAAASPEEVAAALAKEVPFEVTTYGKTVAGYVQQQRLGKKAAAAAAAAAGPGALPGDAAPRAASRGRLKVLVMKRDSVGRQIVNSKELIAACNEWRYRPPGSKEDVTAECREVSFPDLATGVAAAREADVFIGMHGANLANGWMMRPGASVIEIIPYEFETVRGAMSFSVGTALDATAEVLWWVAVVCDPAMSTPGPNELAGLPLKEWWPRDRNVAVPWKALDEVLMEVVAAEGSQQRWMEDYWGKAMHRFNLNATGVHSRGGARCPGKEGSGQ